jgi:hypothetical protein
MAGGDGPTGMRARCQVVVIGDPGTGKSSLIVAVATDSFPEKVPPVLPPTRLPHDFYPDRVPLTIVDTSSRSVGFPLLPLVSLGPRVHVTAVPAPPVPRARRLGYHNGSLIFPGFTFPSMQSIFSSPLLV